VTESVQLLQIEVWHIDRLVFYARNPRKNDAAVNRVCSSIREFGFKIPVLARGDGEVVDGHLRLKAARKLGSWPGGAITGIPVILCDEWTPAQVKAFRLMVNRSVTSFPPHVMFYAPNLTNEDIGSNGKFEPGLPSIAYQGPQGFMIVVLGDTRHSAH